MFVGEKSRNCVAAFCTQDLTGLKFEVLAGTTVLIGGPSSSLVVGRICFLAVAG